MSKLSHLLLRAIAAFGLALPLIAVAGSPAAAAPTATHFFADHSRDCDYAFTEGRIEWNPIHVGQVARVDVTGVLADVPVRSIM